VFIPILLTSLIGMSSEGPAQLAKCKISTPISIPVGDGDFETIGSYALHVRFLNTSPQPIARVTFTLDDNSSVSDVGTFSHGVTINHTLGIQSTHARSCSITAVDFADGTMWHAGGSGLR
jgi:hypothetical protein